MSNMPEMNIAFSSQGNVSVTRSEKGSVLLVLRGEVPEENPIFVLSKGDIPAQAGEKNTEYIKMALLGNETAPRRVICFFIGEEDGLDDVFAWAETNKVDYIAMPTCETDSLTNTIKDFVKAQKQQHNMIKAVLPNCSADCEYIINFVTESVTVGEKKYSAEEMTARIAGIIAGTSAEHSVTYALIPEATDCQRMTQQQMETAAGDGKLFCFFDGEKVKLSRGVNSLKTFSGTKGKEFSKIKNIEVISGIDNDIRTLCQDYFIGKFGNSYSNRCLLVSAIGNYLDAYVSDSMIDSYEVGFDIQGIKAAMSQSNIDFSAMSDEEIVAYDFGTGVYLAVRIKLRDAIEDIVINVAV